MNKEELDKHFEEVDRKQEEKGRAMLCLYSLIAFVVGVALIIALVVVVVKLANEEPLDDFQPSVIVVNDTTVTVDYVLYVIDDVEYTEHDFCMLADIPTVIDVHVFYTDSTDVIKPAYVCYDDIAELKYEDNAYGKVVLPQQ